MVLCGHKLMFCMMYVYSQNLTVYSRKHYHLPVKYWLEDICIRKKRLTQETFLKFWWYPFYPYQYSVLRYEHECRLNDVVNLSHLFAPFLDALLSSSLNTRVGVQL